MEKRQTGIFSEILESSSAYLYLARNAFLSSISFRLKTFINMLSETIRVAVQVMLWYALFSNNRMTDGVGIDEMISYLILSGFLRMFLSIQAGSMLAYKITGGNIATDLLKPLRIKLSYVSYSIGSLAADLFLRTIPLFIVWIFVFRIQAPASAAALGASLLFVVFGIIINYQADIIISQLAFWLQETWYLHWFHQALMLLFSGSLVPLWFYPDWLKTAADFFPFKFTSFIPLSFYLGKTELGQVPGFAITGIIWIAVLGIIEKLVWQRGIRRIVIFGG